jgi:hypothetical protein
MTKSTNQTMLDSVALKIKYPSFKVTNPDFFTPALNLGQTAPSFSYGHNRYMTYRQNPTAMDKKEDIYKPRLTVNQRFDDGIPSWDLLIEFSIPKLLYDQSLQETNEGDCEKVVSKLQFRLQRMGVQVTADVIRNAIVNKAHFCKNIPLSPPLTAQGVIAELYKADPGMRKDVNMRHYENGGQSLYFYATAANIIFYDKIKDISTSKNRAVEKDKFDREKMLLANAPEDKKPELLRFEVRFARQASLEAFLSKVMHEKMKDIPLKRIFDKNLCRDVLLASWDKIVGTPTSQLALKMTMPIEEVFDAIIRNLGEMRNAHSLNNALAGLGIYILINQHGSRNTRKKIERNWSSRSWKRLAKKIQAAAVTLKDLPTSHAIQDVHAALLKFERFDWHE